MSWSVITGPDFPKDLDALPARIRQRVKTFVFEGLPAAATPLGLGKLKKLKGHQGFYRVRFGEYRLGLFLDARQRRVHVLRVLHRRDIYRHFP